MKEIKIFYTNQVVCDGVYSCLNCGKKLFLEKKIKLPKCPKCGLDKFTIERKF